VSVKQGLAYQSAILEPHAEVRRRITDGARAAVEARLARKGPAAFCPDPPLALAMSLATAEAAMALEALPGVERVAPADVTVRAESAADLLQRFFRALTILYSVRDTA
jgi:D-aminopeptidase